MIALIFGWLAALSLLIAPRAGRYGERFSSAMVITIAVYVILAIIGLTLLAWASDPALWKNAFSFHYLMPWIGIPYLFVAVLDSSMKGNPKSWRIRFGVIYAIAIVFAVTLSTQSIVWLNLTNHLRDIMAQSPNTCLSTDSDALAWMRNTPLDHRMITAYSIILQGKAPQKVVMPGNDCMNAITADGIRIVPWQIESGQGGWFDLSRLAGR